MTVKVPSRTHPEVVLSLFVLVRLFSCWAWIQWPVEVAEIIYCRYLTPAALVNLATCCFVGGFLAHVAIAVSLAATDWRIQKSPGSSVHMNELKVTVLYLCSVQLSWGSVVHLDLSVKLQQGDEARGRSLGGGIEGCVCVCVWVCVCVCVWGGSHMAADKERGQSWQGLGNGDGRREGRGNHTGRTTCSPSAKAESSDDLCVSVCVSVCVRHWLTIRLIESNMEACVLTALMPQVWTGPGVCEWLRVGESEEKSIIPVCVWRRERETMFMYVWLSVGVSQPGSWVCLRSLSTSWVSQVLGCPLMPPGPPITAALQAHSVNCHLLPDQY